MKKNARAKRKKKKSSGRFYRGGRELVVVLAIALAVILLVLAKGEKSDPRRGEVQPSPQRPSPEASPARRVPPFHQDPSEARPFPETLSPSLFDNPVVARAYQIAGEMPEVLVQQPCYCLCERQGHRSLLDCYTGYHGAG